MDRVIPVIPASSSSLLLEGLLPFFCFSYSELIDPGLVRRFYNWKILVYENYIFKLSGRKYLNRFEIFLDASEAMKVVTHILKNSKTSTYLTPIDDGLSGHAEKRIAGRYRDNPAFHDILCKFFFFLLFATVWMMMMMFVGVVVGFLLFVWFQLKKGDGGVL